VGDEMGCLKATLLEILSTQPVKMYGNFFFFFVIDKSTERQFCRTILIFKEMNEKKDENAIKRYAAWAPRESLAKI